MVSLNSQNHPSPVIIEQHSAEKRVGKEEFMAARIG